MTKTDPAVDLLGTERERLDSHERWLWDVLRAQAREVERSSDAVCSGRERLGE